MLSKIAAAEIAMRAGGIAVIANGKRPKTLERIFTGEAVGTVFLSSSRMQGKRRWIAYAAIVRGRVTVNAGARDAILQRKASLLSSGVIAIEGDFESQDVISINDTEGREIARGMASCTKGEIQHLIGRSPGGPQDGSASARKGRIFVPRDNIVILEESPDL